MLKGKPSSMWVRPTRFKVPVRRASEVAGRVRLADVNARRQSVINGHGRGDGGLPIGKREGVVLLPEVVFLHIRQWHRWIV